MDQHLRKETRIVFCLWSYKVALLRLETLESDAQPYNLIYWFDQNTVPTKNKNILKSFQSKYYVGSVTNSPTNNSEDVGFMLAMAEI